MQFGFEQCPYCGSTAGFVYVHGHYQCRVCNQNVMPCCGGEQEVSCPQETTGDFSNKQKNTMRDFRKYYIIPAEPEVVYAALTNEATIELWTGDKAEMKPVPGTEFSMWDGSIVGKILELEDGRKIVQQWYFGEEETDAPSIVTIKLHKDKKGTSLELRHTNIPDEDYDDIVDGWNNNYMADLQEFYEEEE